MGSFSHTYFLPLWGSSLQIPEHPGQDLTDVPLLAFVQEHRVPGQWLVWGGCVNSGRWLLVEGSGSLVQRWGGWKAISQLVSSLVSTFLNHPDVSEPSLQW